MKVVIIGAGSTAYMVADLISSDKNFYLEGFIGTPEEEEKFREKELYGMGSFIGDHSIIPHLYKDGVFGFVAAVGDNYLREKNYYECMRHNLYPVNVISRDVVTRHNVKIGKGVVIGPGVILCGGVTIGDNVILHPGAICNINTKIGDHSTVGPGAIIRGLLEVGKNTSIGAGSYIGADVGKNNVVPVGKKVTKTISDKFREK